MFNRIREIREARNMTQAELAKLIGTTSASVSRYEKETHRVTLPTLEKIARALRVAPADIISTSGGEFAREAAVFIPVMALKENKKMALDADLAAELGPVNELEVVVVPDDSMEPTLRAGDICVVDTSQTSVNRDGLYIIDGGSGHVIIRRVAYNPIKRAYVASADNKLYPEVWDIHEDDLTFLGRVAYAGRRM